MSQPTAAHPSENAKPESIAEKGAMPNRGNRPALTTQRNRTPTTESARSATHGDSANNATEDASGGNKSRSTSARRSSTKSSVSPSSYKRPLSSTLAGSAMRLENQYSLKKKRYQTLKKDLMDKQKIAQDLYNDMVQLREKVIASGAKDPGKMEDLKVEVGSPKPPPPIEQVVEDEEAESSVEKLAIASEFMDTLEHQLQEIPRKSQNLCRELLNKQSEFVTFVGSQLKTSDDENEEDDSTVKVSAQLDVHRKDYESLQACLDDIKALETKTVEDILKNARSMMEKFESHGTKVKESKGSAEGQRELQSQLNTTLEELQMERERSNQSKERLRQAEAQLKGARAKIRDLEAHVANNEGKIQMLQSNLKNMENQMRQKEQTTELKMKELQKTLKSSEVLIAKVEKQRDSYETRLVELKEKISHKENETMNNVKELSEKLDAVTTEVGKEKERRQEVEEAYRELEERYKELEEKSNQLYELSEKNKDIIITEGHHSENEVCLFNELQEARKKLEMQKDMLLQLEQEKEQIVAVMHRAVSLSEEDDSKEKLVADLASMTNDYQKLMMKYSELQRAAKNAQENNGILEAQLIEIRRRLHSQSKEGGIAGLSAHAIELQQCISDLRNNLAEVTRQNEELKTELTQKHLEVEQRDRVIRNQTEFLKARDELLNTLKGNVQQENADLSNSDENNEYIEQITAKTEAIQELYSTLESKQVQIMHLEKMVKLMENQQDRAQAQRTRMEDRIAQLELALQRNREQRYVRDRSSFPSKVHAYSDRDRTSENYSSDLDQPPLQQSSNSPYFSRKNQYDLVAQRSDVLLSSIASQTNNRSLHDYERQTSSDEEQPYICEFCRQEAVPIEKDGQWSDRNDPDDSSRESFRDRFKDRSTLEMTRHTADRHNFHDDNYVYDPPANVQSRKYTGTSCNLHEQSDNLDDSSRESLGPYQREGYRHHRHPFHYIVRPSSRTRPTSSNDDLGKGFSIL